VPENDFAGSTVDHENDATGQIVAVVQIGLRAAPGLGRIVIDIGGTVDHDAIGVHSFGDAEAGAEHCPGRQPW
jgi:hypothetical protein